MSVYVDEAVHPFGRMVMCHMVADSSEELLAMAARIGVAERWIQFRGTHREHFDVCKSKRAIAIDCGAQPISRRDLVAIINKRRQGYEGRARE
jgi:hypothetical protein